MAESSPETFGEVRARLDEIVTEVRSKDISLEKSLDLYEERPSGSAIGAPSSSTSPITRHPR